MDFDREIDDLRLELERIQARIAFLKNEKKKAEKKKYLETHQYSRDASGRTYRVATEKMLEFAEDVQDARPAPGTESLVLQSKGGRIPSLDEYRTSHFPNSEDDDFNLVRSYLGEWSPVARDIWNGNRLLYRKEAERTRRNSIEYREMVARENQWKKEAEEEERHKWESEEWLHRIYGYGHMEYSGPSEVYIDEFGNS